MPTILDSGDLRNRAESILGNLNSSPLERPVFVEFAGTPKSGKSTCIDIVSHFFRRVGFNVLAPTEGASRRTPYYLRTDWVAFNTWSASYALTHILEGLHHSDRYHLAILDRGLFDALAWFQLLDDDGRIPSQTRETVQKFLLVANWRSVIDSVFLFTADSATSLEREEKDKLIAEQGMVMNTERLESLNRAYAQVRRDYGNEFRNFNAIDTSDSENTNARSTAAQVTDKILDLFPDVS